MLTVLNFPPLVALTGNPVLFTVHSDGMVESAAVQSRINLYFSMPGAEDMTINLTWGSVDLTLTCKPGPDESGTQIPDATIEPDLTRWVQLVVDCMVRNYYIARDWTLVVADSAILMYGKQGNLGTPTVSFDWHAETPPGWATVSGVPEKPRLFYKIGLQVWINKPSGWEMIGEDLLPVNLSGDARFDIHDLFTDHLYPEFLWPQRSSLQFMDLRPHSTLEYHIRYYEQYGCPVVPGIITRSQSFYGLVGGISTSQLALYNRQGSNFWEKLSYNQYFLTWQPKVKWVSMDQVEKLFFFCQTEMTRLTLRIDSYFLDGSRQLSAAWSAIDLPPDKGVVELTVSPAIISPLGNQRDQIDYYTVYTEYQSERISEVRTYHIDRTYYENPRYFLFLNSLGGYDTLRTTGNQEDSLEYERVSVRRILPAEFTDNNHQNATLFTSESRVYKANTGWITRGELSWLRDFFLSRQVFLMSGDQLIPVVITTTQARQRTDGDELYFLEFEYRRSFESRFYSREIIPAGFSSDFNDDFPSE